MARNRQRSKQRQAERRARRLQQDAAEGRQPRRDDAGSIPGVTPAPVEPADAPGIDPDLLVGAPPEEEGRSDFVLEHEEGMLDEGPVSEDEALEEIEDWEVADQLDDPEAAGEATRGSGEAGYAVQGRRGRAAAEAHKDRPRVIQFLIAVWAELQRVQWPNRQALVTLTGVVLGFVLIAGGYLGLLDAIFSELIQAIL
jgi:preprotein translocase subunit SecE